MKVQFNKIIKDKKTGAMFIFLPIDKSEIISKPEDPLSIEGRLERNSGTYEWFHKKYLRKAIAGRYDYPNYTGSGVMLDPNEVGLEKFFRTTRALHKDPYFKNSIDFKNYICAIRTIGDTTNEARVIENYQIIKREGSGFKLTKRGTEKWDSASNTVMNKIHVFSKKRWEKQKTKFGIK